MKKHVLRLSLLSLVTLSVFSACKKDKDGSGSTSYVGTYKITDITMKMAGMEEVSMFENADPCEKDNTYELKADNSVVVTDAGTKCEGSETITGTWKQEGNKLIVEAGFDVNGSFSVVKNDGKVLVLSETYTEGGMSVTTTVSLAKQ